MRDFSRWPGITTRAQTLLSRAFVQDSAFASPTGRHAQNSRPYAVRRYLPCCRLPARERQALTLEDCRISAGPGYPGIKARCGTMLRPENPADPDSPEIELRLPSSRRST